MLQKTSIEGVFTCGDSASPIRSVANAETMGKVSGSVVNNMMTEQEFDRE